MAFLAFGAAIGSWIPRLPTIKDQLLLTDGEIGLALVVYAAGAVAGAVGARFILARGSRAFVRVGLVALCAGLVTPGLAASLTELVAAVLLLGLCSGFIDVLLNAQAAELERIAARPMINGFHGFWSLGAIIGSVTAGAAAYAGIRPLQQFVSAAIVIVAASAWFLRDLPDTRSGAAPAAPVDAGRLWLTGSIVAVAAVACCSILVEGGSADWSALYLRELSHANPGLAAAGFAGFAAAAAAVRFGADRLTAHTSPAAVTRLGAVTAASGLALAILFPALPGAITGFALVGVGTAVLVPLAFAAGANLGQSGTALTVVMSAGYAGSVVGPALIGTAADHFGLRPAMAIPLLGALVVLGLAGSLRSSGAVSAAQPAGR